ncbi:acyltransferase family protein, partial [Photobacterium lucens]|uniref:acyltransferase family protein n=1 Tax=Photobacterium lucens TaxID=2562949 RepID=UPI001CA39344
RNTLYSFIIILLLCFVNYYFNTAFGFEQSIIIGLVFFMLIKGCDFFGLLKNAGLNYLGRISYSIYITHGIILYFLFSIIFPTICEDISFNQYMMLSPIVFIIVLLFSAFSSKYIEYPMMRYGQKLIKP